MREREARGGRPRPAMRTGRRRCGSVTFPAIASARLGGDRSPLGPLSLLSLVQWRPRHLAFIWLFVVYMPRRLGFIRLFLVLLILLLFWINCFYCYLVGLALEFQVVLFMLWLLSVPFRLVTPVLAKCARIQYLNSMWSS